MKRGFAMLSVSLLALAPVAAFAQDGGAGSSAAADDGIGEIVVTAQRREQNIQDVPISITAISGEALTEVGIRDPRDLSILVPGLSSQAGTSATTTSLFLRGVGIGDFNSNTTGAVGVYVDDVFLGANAGKLFNVFDSDGIEVLKGPQGTLYGRNTTAGAIRFSSRKPTDEFSANAAISYGRYNEVQVEGGVGGPIAGDVLKARVAGTYLRRDGWLLNRVTGNKLNDLDMWAGRAIVDFTPNSDILIRAIVHGGQNRGGARQFQHRGQGIDFAGNPNFAGGVPLDGLGYADTDGDLNAGDYDIEGQERVDVFGGSLTASIDMGGVSLTSISAYEQVRRRTVEDTDASPNNVLTATYIDRPQQFSQEIRLQSKGENRVNWIVGGYYFHDKLVTDSSFDILRVFRDPDDLLGTLDPVNSIGNFAYAAKRATSALPTEAVMNSWRDANIGNAANRITRAWYTAAGNLRFTVDAEGYVTRNDYDAEGRLTAIKRWPDKIVTTDVTSIATVDVLTLSAGTAIIETRTYDAAGHLSTTTDGEGVITAYYYYANGSQYLTVFAYGTADEARVVRGFDGAGRVVSEYAAYGQPEQAVTAYSYDGLGNLTSVTDPRGKVTTFSYDERGLRLTATDAAGGITTYQYNAFGEVTQTTDAAGNETYSYYDALGRVVMTRDAENYITETSYTRFGEIASVTRRYNKTVSAASTTTLPAVAAQLTLPTGVSRNTHNASTFKPYDPAEIIGEPRL